MVAHAVLAVIGSYLGCGMLFAAVFVIWGVGQIDPAARGTSFAFRLLIAPGTVLLWPALAWKWRAVARRSRP
jgi:hypothetical protein